MKDALLISKYNVCDTHLIVIGTTQCLSHSCKTQVNFLVCTVTKITEWVKPFSCDFSKGYFFLWITNRPFPCEKHELFRIATFFSAWTEMFEIEYQDSVNLMLKRMSMPTVEPLVLHSLSCVDLKRLYKERNQRQKLG